jgi:hypothetical protein
MGITFAVRGCLAAARDLVVRIVKAFHRVLSGNPPRDLRLRCICDLVRSPLSPLLGDRARP